MDKQAVDFVKEKLKSDFEILKKWIPVEKTSELDIRENILILLREKIKKLIESDYRRLMEILYAADINESKVRDAFGADRDIQVVAGDIAILYLERMIQKWNTRQQYQSDIKGDWD